KSFIRFLRQTSLPSLVCKQTSSPRPPSAYTRSPSTVGVARGPSPQRLSSKVKIGPSLVCQTSLPELTSRAMTYSTSLHAPIVYSRSATTAGPEKPMPALVKFHSSGGPPLGQALSRPVSLETSVRSGPRHCGQSAPKADNAAAARQAAAGSSE